VLGDIKPGGAAEQAGLRKGDRVVLIDGAPVADASRCASASANRARRRAAGVALDEGACRAPAGIAVRPRPASVKEGEQTRRVGRIEAYVGGMPETVLVRRARWRGSVQGASKTLDISVLQLRTSRPHLIGQASLSNLSGPLTIADVAGQLGRARAAHYLCFLALVSVGLGALNLLPLPMLDGGHLLFHAFEGDGAGRCRRCGSSACKGAASRSLLLMSVALATTWPGCSGRSNPVDVPSLPLLRCALTIVIGGGGFRAVRLACGPCRGALRHPGHRASRACSAPTRARSSAALPFRIGDTYTDEKGSVALRALFATGLFKDVRIEIEGRRRRHRGRAAHHRQRHLRRPEGVRQGPAA
jgi:regulator of sigma E protease